MLVNNAGIGLFGAFGPHRMATVRDVFENQHVRRDGDDAGCTAPIPRTQIGRGGERDLQPSTLTPMPLVAVYTASKMAIEGFAGSLAHKTRGVQRSRQAG